MDKSVRKYLYSREAQNALLLGLWETCDRSSSYLISLKDVNNEISLVAIYVSAPYKNLILSHTNLTDPTVLINKLIELKTDLGGIVGPESFVKPFVVAWSAKTKQKSQLVMEQMLYELTVLKEPSGIEGKARLLNKKDYELQTDWNIAFRAESLPLEPLRRVDAEKAAQMAIVNQDTFVWEVKGEAVSSAQIARPTENTMTIRFVYTPPAYRKKGYGSAVTAVASSEIMKRGKKSCLLYTDAKNPTSNKIYQNLGYSWICNSIYYRFSVS
jgi:uncharacterized protein